jgi:hypothetical protein
VNTSKPKVDKEKEDCWSTMGNDDMMETNTGETLMAESNGNGKIDVLIDQVGRLTEGLTDLRGLVERVAQSTERQEHNLDRLATLFEKQSQQQSETTQRLVRIVEGLLEKK